MNKLSQGRGLWGEQSRKTPIHCFLILLILISDQNPGVVFTNERIVQIKDNIWTRLQVIVLNSYILASNFYFMEIRMQNLIEARLIKRAGAEKHCMVFVPSVCSLSVTVCFLSSHT